MANNPLIEQARQCLASARLDLLLAAQYLAQLDGDVGAAHGEKAEHCQHAAERLQAIASSLGGDGQ